MGYLNNSTRTLDAILTKKGREILSSGGDFDVTKFALGDDEIDYSLWDTSHTQGTDYYGAVIENLPGLEPFNDPSEIMKYKLVTRTVGTRAMALLKDLLDSPTTARLAGLIYDEGEPTDRVGLALTTSTIGISSATIGIKHKDNSSFFSQGTDYQWYWDELYTITLLDASVAVLAPAFSFTDDDGEHIPTVGNAQTGMKKNMTGDDFLWVPFIDNVQHISQTLSGVGRGDLNTLRFPGMGPSSTKNLVLYAKQVSATSTTAIIITGEQSGVVHEFPITITYS